MSIESPGGGPAGTIRDLGLPGRAVTALLRAGVTTTEELAGLSRRELAAIDGLGPGLIAAIRTVVPEPVTRVPRATPSEAEVHTEAVAAGIEADDEAPTPPPIPSFESLRAPRRRTTVDLIVPATPPPEEAAPAAGPWPAAANRPRPAEYADLRRLCVRGARAAAGVPVRLAWWSLRAPVTGLRRLLGR
ncbi:hypothetical protein ACI789_16615 [Geodermatophilus sp. SYSU D00965]